MGSVIMAIDVVWMVVMMMVMLHTHSLLFGELIVMLDLGSCGSQKIDIHEIVFRSVWATCNATSIRTESRRGVGGVRGVGVRWGCIR